MMKTMIVTGASRGIGAATAILASQNGYNVIVNYFQNKQAADQVVLEIRKNGGNAFAVRADIASETEIEYLFSECDKHFGRLDSLINNAGILETQAKLEQIDAGRLNRIFAINITGQVICAQQAIKRMAFTHGGRGGTIVNVSSVAAKTGSPNEYIDYAMSKAAIDTLTIGLSKELADEGIRVNCVRPGFIYTDIHAAGGEPARVDRLKSSIPLKRGGLAEEVAEAILWLASDKSSYSTGSFIDVAGGR